MNGLVDLEAQFKARSFALLIGVDRYQFEGGALPTLKCAVNDVQAVSRALVEVGGFPAENILVLTNQDATRGRISAAFGHFRTQLEPLKRERSQARTRFLFYFSGHGLVGTSVGADRTFLATHDTDPNNPGFTGIGWNELDDLVASNIAPDQHLRLIDCCHAAGLPPGARGSGKKLTIEFVMDAVARTEGQAVLFSCQRDELAWERRDGNLSVFATALLDGLQGAVPDTHGIVYLSNLVEYLSNRVPADAMAERGVRQTPVARLEQIRGPMPMGFRGTTIAATQNIVEAGLRQIFSLRQSRELTPEEYTYCENIAANWMFPKDDSEMERVRVLVGFFRGEGGLPMLKAYLRNWMNAPAVVRSSGGAGARGPAAEPAMTEAEKSFIQRMSTAQTGQPNQPIQAPVQPQHPQGYPAAPQYPPQGYPQAPQVSGYPHAAQQTPPPYSPYPAPHATNLPKPPFPMAIAVAGAFVILLLIFGLGAIISKVFISTKPSAVASGVPSAPGVLDQFKARTEAKTGNFCPNDMVLVEGGAFIMGSNEGDANEKPPHPETVASFCMHRFEVTTAQYRACGVSGKCKQDASELTPIGDDVCNLKASDREQHAVNCVKQSNAAAYCAAMSARLPSEKEWEYAAKGGAENRVYPWGAAAPTNRTTNGCGPECKEFTLNFYKTINKPLKFTLLYPDPDAAPLTATPGSFPQDVSRWGAYDMGGNVAEWTSTFYCGYNDTKCVGTELVARGGSWYDWVAGAFRSSTRSTVKADMKPFYLGFRCARDLSPPSATSK